MTQVKNCKVNIFLHSCWSISAATSVASYMADLNVKLSEYEVWAMTGRPVGKGGSESVVVSPLKSQNASTLGGWITKGEGSRQQGNIEENFKIIKLTKS